MKIEKGHALPEKTPSSKYPFADMEIGDSFLAPAEQNESTVRSAAARFEKATGKRFIFEKRDQTKHGETGLRCWRVDPAQYPKRTRTRTPKAEAETPVDTAQSQAVGF